MAAAKEEGNVVKGGSTQQDAADELTAAVKELYRVFKRYQIRSPVEGCSCCVSANDVARLESKPLRQLEADDLELYARKSLTTWGSLHHFKHFLPRICELLAADPEFPVDREIVLGKFTYGDWQNWPRVESACVREYFVRWWRWLLSCPVQDELRSPIDEGLCALSQAEERLAEYLDFWRHGNAPFAPLHLACFLHENHAPLLKKQHLLYDGFWRVPQMSEVIAWLCDPETGRQLEAAFFEATEDSLRASFSQAMQEWDWLCASRLA